MKKTKLKTPVLLIAFNRPDITEKVFQQIRKARPKKLFFAVDGPREGNKKDLVNVKKVRKIINGVDWKCDVKKLFRKKNIGCRKAESSAMDWFFRYVEEGILFEDDCLPTQDFFVFCEELLEKYRDDERIMHISGNNFLKGWKRDNYSYYFSKYPFSWGWATWRRAWKKYDVDVKLYPKIKNKEYIKDIFNSSIEISSAKSVLEAAYNGWDTWDYQWFFALLVNEGLAIIPNKNLVRNIGFREDSTHTKEIDYHLSIGLDKMEFPLKHPPFIIRDRKSDEKYFQQYFWKRVRNFLLKKTGLVRFLRIKD